MISDDELLLYYYRDGLETEDRARIGAALAAQPELAQRLHRLVGLLDAAAAMPEVPVPPAAMSRWRAALGDAALDDAGRSSTRRDAPRAGRAFRTPWLAAAALAMLAALSLLEVSRGPQPVVPTAPLASTAPNAAAYERGLKTHLANTERQLASFEAATPEERAHLVDTILEQNRLYALAAERAGKPKLARVLRAFAPVLESLEHDDGDTDASVAQLAFELRVMQGRLGATSAGHLSTDL